MLQLDVQKIYLDKDLYIDLLRESLVKNGVIVHFSRIQFRIISLLANYIGKITSSEELIQHAWGPDSLITIEELYVYISRIRRKLEECSVKPKYLLTVRGRGYILYSYIN